MSEYQYYEFQAVDRPLTKAEMRELRAVSTRATITSTRFVNEYEWGDLKADPARWMERYFDAFLYYANWGTHWLMLRLPSPALDPRTAQEYLFSDSARTRRAGGFTILEFLSEEEEPGDEWYEEGQAALASLVPLRAELAAGDRRVLYLAWLLSVQNEEIDEDETEPPVPPGLGELTAGLRAFAEFLRIDDDLIAAAAERSSRIDDSPPRKDLARWIATLPESEKDRLLLEAAARGVHPRTELLRGFGQARNAASSRQPEPRTVAELLATADDRAGARQQKAAERAARDQARREQEVAEARERHLARVAKEGAEAWRRVDALVATRRPAAYDEAANLLKDLREIGVRDGRAAEVDARIQALREEHGRKQNFLLRLKRIGL